MNDNPGTGYGRLLCEEPFIKMYADFSSWRMSDFVKQLEATKEKGRVLPFVRGLRLSAHLIYAVRDILSGTGLEANWGHLLDKDRVFCSCECDVIIHRSGYFARWDGSIHPVMDFKFIKQQDAVVVISCKSLLRSRAEVDREYCELMKPFVKRVWLFAECCGPRSANSIREQALRCGYEKFWYLYTWTEGTEPEPNRGGWNEFVEEVEKLKQ